MAEKDPTSGPPLVLGGDLGGTSTRILIADHTGTVVGRGIAGGGNPTSRPDSAAAALGEALAAALVKVRPEHVRTALLGAAGGGALKQPEVRAKFDAVWSGAGLTCSAEYLPDLEVAFASGTPESNGTALIAGTGAGAGAIRDHRATRTADAHGWLVGDDGSGFWLGREAVRSTLRALDLSEPTSQLSRLVTEAVIGPDANRAWSSDASGFDRLRDELIRVIYSRPPVQLAELARTVVSAYDAGDQKATEIVERAAALLTETVSLVRDPTETGPIVLAGSVAGEGSPVGRALRKNIANRFSAPILSARDGVGGATWLALSALDPTLATHQTHTRLVS